ncbi:molybdenum cofactor guanylyltransferase [Bacillus swezeyi]|uniref:Probable molybdenum cofactor guanylyltransferase n=1 Tax=Bacillus swezeyi TaxID=1925020 RepID=A0A1R1QKJ0_9BACI|nr:molybdenum cofactor guanylyltransferase [Bacillus swezeyi]MEC1262314.1 molybdenum cofactor guanylyltransferase [Bacillus swezeyi]MED1741616.1 molybdenum cofactor guanylyltransferase [Bacillus swezeyi]MED2926977.1 molybdenum cofactor guanylyltransferase [Bacillus swezeyi]MED2943244.1 molybdenum cofactor guanylyltransferase [Bacillus swezeyi]MED2965461.1 molybdenum cofactor guanylyltransferase [Bacillus swezeyi]
MKPVHIVLSGGLSRRFGEPKAFALWKNKPLYQWCKQAFGGEALILSRPGLTDRFRSYGEKKVLEDVEPFEGKGPLAGIYTAMVREEGDVYVILACDTPLIRKSTISALKEQMTPADDAVVTVADGRAQPLVAVYHKRVKHILYDQLRRDELKISCFLERIRVKYIEAHVIGAEPWEFINVNKKSDLDKIETIFSE